jgi:dTDP-L-rhamnose 4-epimerase
MGTALMLELLISEHYPIQKVVVASSMSIYGEGAYCTQGGETVFPLLRPQEQLVSHKWEMYSHDGQEELLPAPTNEEKPLNPTSIYAISKRDQEEMCLAVGRAYNLPMTALRFFNVYGPRQALSNPYTGVAAIFSSRLLNGKAPLIFEDGRQSRDFIHVKDIVQGLILAMEKEEANFEAINIGTGRRTSIRDLAEMLIKHLRIHIKPEIVNKFRAGDIRHCYADISKAQKLLGFQPKINLEDSLPEMVDWLRTQIAEDKVETAASELSQRGLTV